MTEKLVKADQLHDQHIQTIKKKAESENSKVPEVAFITKMSQETKKLQIQKKLEESEARRIELLEERKRKLEEKQSKKEEDAQERRKLLETKKLIVCLLKFIFIFTGETIQRQEKERRFAFASRNTRKITFFGNARKR